MNKNAINNLTQIINLLQKQAALEKELQKTKEEIKLILETKNLNPHKEDLKTDS